jgi:hypothetical protein
MPLSAPRASEVRVAPRGHLGPHSRRRAACSSATSITAGWRCTTRTRSPSASNVPASRDQGVYDDRADGFQSDGFKVQFSFKYNFSYKLGGQ